MQQVALTGRGGLAPGGILIHDGHVEAGLAGAVAVAGLLGQLHTLFVVLAGALVLADFPVEIAQLVMERAELGDGGRGTESQSSEVVFFGCLGVLQ